MSASPNLTSPCHNAAILIIKSGYNDEVEVMCMADGCHNSWDKNGESE